MKTPGMNIRHAKQRGGWAELRFMTKATEHGFKLAKPWAEYLPYDFVIDLGGRFVSVQVKSTMYRMSPRENGQRRGHFEINLRKCGSRGYQLADFHCLAVYVIPKDAWYIIPFVFVSPRNSIEVCPGNPANKYERYREAWHLLRELPLTSAPGVPLDEDVRHHRRPSSATRTKVRTKGRVGTDALVRPSRAGTPGRDSAPNQRNPSNKIAAKRRQNAAHGVSRGWKAENEQAPAGRKNAI
ncbi:MAG TPA: group I intron-associated PD-(D/E)XK endonuclease [Terriglobales bacterium]